MRLGVRYYVLLSSVELLPSMSTAVLGSYILMGGPSTAVGGLLSSSLTVTVTSSEAVMFFVSVTVSLNLSLKEYHVL